MSSVTFPTSSGNAKLGMPVRDPGCHCDEGPMVFDHDGHCFRCGHYEVATISETWGQRIRVLVRRAKAKRARALAETPPITAEDVAAGAEQLRRMAV